MIVELIRHGKTPNNEKKRYQGIMDAPLSDGGIAEIAESSERPPLVYVTYLQRTQQTAGIIFPGVPQVIVEGLHEMDFGVFDGQTAKEMENFAPFREWVDGNCQGRCPGGESMPEFKVRISAAFKDVIARTKVRGEEKVTIVAHGGVQMALMSQYANSDKDYWQWQTPPACGFIFEVKEDGEGFAFSNINEIKHVKD